MSPPRVLLISSLPPPHGGVSAWTESFIDLASAGGIDLRLFRVGAKSEADIKPLSSRIRRAGRGLFGAQLAIVAGAGRRCETVHVTTSGGQSLWRGIALARTALASGKAAILHLHSSIDTCSPIARRALESLARSRGVRIVTPSHEDAAGHSFFTLIDNFVSESFSRGHSWQGPSAGKTLRLVYVGWMNREKGLFELSEAVANTENVEVDCYGPDVSPEVLAELEREWRKRGLTERIRYLGTVPRSEIASVLAGYDALVLPSHRESFGLVVAEAMSIGLPVIATRVGFLWDMQENLYFPVAIRAPKEMEKLFVELQADKSLLIERSQKARHWMTTTHEPRKILEEWRALYESLPQELG